MAAKDLQLTGKDLQMAGSNGGRSGGPSAAGTGRSGSDSRLDVFSIVRRRWLVLLLAAVASGTAAYFVSDEFKTVTTTAHLQLKSSPLPLANSVDVYTTPRPDAVAEILMTPEVLQDVIDEFGLPPWHRLIKALKADPDVRTGTLDLQLSMADDELLLQALNGIGARLITVVREQRIALLRSHRDYVRSLQMPATQALDQARSNLIAELRSEAQPTGGQMQQAARVQALLTRQLQLESTAQSATRHIDRLGREIEYLTSRSLNRMDSARRRILEGRRRQVEQHGKGFTAATRSFAAREQLLAELATLESSLNSQTDSTQDDSGDAAAPAPNPDNSTSDEAVSEAEQDSPVDRLNAQAESLLAWQEQVLAVGQTVVGDPDPTTSELIKGTFEDLSADAEQIRQLELERAELAVDRNHSREILTETAEKLEEALAVEPLAAEPKSRAQMAAEADVARTEKKHAFLWNRLEQIEQIMQCPDFEYVVSSAASFDKATDVSSDRRKLFAFAFLGCGLCLLSPIALLEYLALRPSPGDVLSQRWNLPMLGTQTVARGGRSAATDLDEHELQPGVRLMALRIQQSLYLPSGRVVLFSGLDHEHSPLMLIRELARCLSQREESVLVVQTLPNRIRKQLTQDHDQRMQDRRRSVTESGSLVAGERRSGRPGVAEYLAGDYDDASSLVMGTGLPGIDFLPGGSTATAAEVMASSRLTSLIDQFRGTYTIILLSGPSTSNPADLQMLAARADGIVFTVCKQSLRTGQGDAVISDLIELGAPILGFAEQAPRGRHAVPFPASPEAEGLTEFAAAL